MLKRFGRTLRFARLVASAAGALSVRVQVACLAILAGLTAVSGGVLVGTLLPRLVCRPTWGVRGVRFRVGNYYQDVNLMLSAEVERLVPSLINPVLAFGTLLVGESRTLEFTAKLPDTLPGILQINNTAVITSDTFPTPGISKSAAIRLASAAEAAARGPTLDCPERMSMAAK